MQQPTVCKPGHTAVERASDRELVITRDFHCPARILFEAWTTPVLLKQWWAPRSMGISLLSCEVDVRTGGRYRFGFGSGDSETMTFFGKYTEVVPYSRLAWTNEEGEGISVTAVTFTEQGEYTQLILREVYPSREALDSAIVGMEGGTCEQFDQLDQLLASQNAD